MHVGGVERPRLQKLAGRVSQRRRAHSGATATAPALGLCPPPARILAPQASPARARLAEAHAEWQMPRSGGRRRFTYLTGPDPVRRRRSARLRELFSAIVGELRREVPGLALVRCTDTPVHLYNDLYTCIPVSPYHLYSWVSLLLPHP